MLARDRRLRRARDFENVWRSRIVARHPALILRSARVQSSPGRCGFVVSKAVAKQAVVRNRLKRQLRAIMKHHTIPPHTDIAFITQRPALKLTYAELGHIVSNLLFAATPGRSRGRTY